jgi:hypothetical protein
MIDIEHETLVSLNEATRILPGNPHVSTLHRWRLRGVKNTKLETVLAGGRRFTSREALDRFIAATTAAADGTPLPVRTPAKRARDIEKAEKELRGELKVTRTRKVHGGNSP